MFEVSQVDPSFLDSAEYLDLYRRSGASAFQHPTWLRELYGRLLRSRKAAPVIVCIRSRESGRPVLVLPLVARHRYLVRVLEGADLGVSDYAGLVCDPDLVAVLGQDRRLPTAISRALGAYDVLRLNKIADPQTMRLLQALLPGSVTEHLSFRSHHVAIGAPFQAWRSTTLSPTFKKNLDRKRRRLEKLGRLQAEEITNPLSLRAAFEAMRDFRKERFESRSGQDLLQDAACFEFYLSVAQAGSVEGFAKTYGLTLDGRIVAAVFGLSQGGRFLFLLLGHDTESYGNIPLGFLAIESAIEACIRDGQDIFDFTIGDEAYKARFGGVPTPLAAVWKSGSVKGAIAARAFDGATRLKPHVLRIAEAARRLPSTRVKAEAAPLEEGRER